MRVGRSPSTAAGVAARRSSPAVAVAGTAGSSGRSHPAVAVGTLAGSGLVTRMRGRRTGCWAGIAGRTGPGCTDRSPT